ncbi:MAG: cyanophycin synthetase, partial [bacterium]
RLRVPGLHNVLDALAAVAVGLELDVPFATAARALEGYAGVARRLQLKGEAGRVLVYDDYGPHPTEVRATIAAARQLVTAPGAKLRVLFQPHRYSRTNLLRDAFGPAFEAADEVVLTEIYPAGEAPIPGVTGRVLHEVVRRHGKPAVELEPELEAACRPIP